MSKKDIWIGINPINSTDIIDLSEEPGYVECDKNLSAIYALDDMTPVSYAFVQRGTENGKNICCLTGYTEFPDRSDDEKEVAAEQVAITTIFTRTDEKDILSPIFDKFVVDERLPNTERIIHYMQWGDLPYRKIGHFHIVSSY